MIIFPQEDERTIEEKKFNEVCFKYHELFNDIVPENDYIDDEKYVEMLNECFEKRESLRNLYPGLFSSIEE